MALLSAIAKKKERFQTLEFGNQAKLLDSVGCQQDRNNSKRVQQGPRQC